MRYGFGIALVWLGYRGTMAMKKLKKFLLKKKITIKKPPDWNRREVTGKSGLVMEIFKI